MIHFSLRPGFAAMAADDSANIRQTNACTFEILLPVQTLEDPEEFVGVIHVEANTIVADE